MPKHDEVNSPSHYTSHPSGIECIEVTRHMAFNVGNAVKYCWRAGLKKNPTKSEIESHIVDLQKAIWYINDEIKLLKGEYHAEKHPDLFDQNSNTTGKGSPSSRPYRLTNIKIGGGIHQPVVFQHVCGCVIPSGGTHYCENECENCGCKIGSSDCCATRA